MMEQPSSETYECKPTVKWWRRILALVGIEITPGWPFHVSLKPRLIYIIFGLLALFLLSLGGMTYYSVQPAFCDSCHIMEPYYDAWSTSNHKFVSCVDCHYPPGSARNVLWHKFQALSQVAKYVTRTYSSKPFAEIQ